MPKNARVRAWPTLRACGLAGARGARGSVVVIAAVNDTPVAVRRMDDTDFEALPFFARLHSRAHGRKTAYTPNADACAACGLCVVACPEDAIKLVRTGG